MKSGITNMYLHKEDLKAIQQFLETFPDADVVEVQSDSSSGIGSIVTATIHSVDVRGVTVSVSKVICDETSW